jgi:hypothetical protein
MCGGFAYYVNEIVESHQRSGDEMFPEEPLSMKPILRQFPLSTLSLGSFASSGLSTNEDKLATGTRQCL